MKQLFLRRLMKQSRPGFLLLDALIGISVFSIFLGAVGFALFASQSGSLANGAFQRGVFLSESALEAVRGIRDSNFDSLVAGTYGIHIGAAGTWELIPTPVTTHDDFTTTLTITNTSDETRHIEVETSWPQRVGANTGSVVLTLDVTDWQQVKAVGNWADVRLQGSYSASNTPIYKDIQIKDTYAFVTSETTPGLSVFDTSDLTNPVRVATTLSLNGDSGYDIRIDENTMYVLSSNASGELRVYDITSPTAPVLTTTFDIPGSSRARSLALFGDTLFVGTVQSFTADEFFAYNIENPSSITLRDSLNDDEGDYMDIALHQGYAYAAHTSDVTELKVIDIFDPQNLAFASGIGYNLTDVHNALAVHAESDTLLLGRVNGSVIEELIAFDISAAPIPSPPPGPYYHEVTGEVRAITTEPTGRYAFAVTDKDDREFFVMDLTLMLAGSPAQVDTYNANGTTAGAGRGLVYDTDRDRVFMITNKALLVLRPS